MKITGDWMVFAAAAVVGFGVMLLFAYSDNLSYYLEIVGLAVISGIFGYLKPKMPWRWGIALVILYPLVIYIRTKVLILPFLTGITSTLAFLFFALPGVLLAYAGALAKRLSLGKK